MPITYQHRVPAATLGGLALAAGQEQYEAKRGQEDRARAVQLAQMAQQQQMQNQRMAYDAASTQYRTAADYNKFVMGAQLDAQQRQQDQQNRLALQNNQDQLGAGREEAQWDRAQEQAGQQDTFGAWKEYVSSTLPALNQDGRDILNTHAGKVRTIMSNQKFNRTQKSAAISMVLEEVQGLGLDQNYAKEQMYEPGKSYNNATGETFLWDGKKAHIQGRHYDGLIKPDDMSDADWMGGGRNEAWMDKYTVYQTRDEDGKRVRHIISNGEMTSIADEDDQYNAAQQEIKDNEMRKDDETLRASVADDRASYANDYLDAMNEASPIRELMVAGQPLDSEDRLQELEDRRKKASKAAAEQYPVPAGRVAKNRMFISEETGVVGADVPATPEELADLVAQPPPEEPVELGGPRNVRQDIKNFLQESMDKIDDPEIKAVIGQTRDILDAVIARGGKATPQEDEMLRKTLRLVNQQKAETEETNAENKSKEEANRGKIWRNKIRDQQGLNVAKGMGGTGEMPSPSAGDNEAMHGVRGPGVVDYIGAAAIGTDLPLSLPAGEPMPGEGEPKMPFERTQEQIAAEEAIRRHGRPTRRTPASGRRVEGGYARQIREESEEYEGMMEERLEELWPGKAVKGEIGSEKAGRIYDALDELDLHDPDMTRERFQDDMKGDQHALGDTEKARLRDQYLTRLKTKLEGKK